MEEGRESRRLATNLKAKCFPKEGKGNGKGNGKECNIINISHGGRVLEFYTSEKIIEGSTLLLEIFPAKAVGPIKVEGMLMWVEQGKKDSIGGIEITSKSDKDKLEALIITLGL